MVSSPHPCSPCIPFGLVYGLRAFTGTLHLELRNLRKRFIHAITFFNSKPIWKQKQHTETHKIIGSKLPCFLHVADMFSWYPLEA
ncbi:MAG: hypothetical protein ACP5N5_04825 [Desulfurococcus sp.]|uniref:hypothetical protein n=1 Tax=Desulfurococcus sp. TaxID=51678 RepID=UPI003D0C8FF0